MMKQSKALAILKSGKNVFLTGSAGAGKTYVLNQYISFLKTNQIPVAITASTGIAATHMNGMTIHSWAGIGVKDSLSPADLQSLKDKKYLTDKIEQVQVLIIDEISMLHKQQLEMVNMVLKFLKKNQLPFGGVQIVFCGDFFQLPPVGRPMEENKDKFAFMSSAWLEASPVVCYISEQYRQSDNSLNRILNEIRNGTPDQTTMDVLTSALKNNVPKSDFITKLYTHNVDVDRINTEKLLHLHTKSKVFQAEIKGNEKLRDLLVKSVLTDAILELRIGTKVMFIKNNYDKGYMNGTLGEVVDFSEDGYPMVRISGDYVIEAIPEDWSIQDDIGNTLASFKQVPLRLAWAITVHKSQGMTLDAAEVDLSKTFERGQGYVALSRLKDIESLFLSGFNAMALQVDPLALKADKRFRELSTEADMRWFDEELEKFGKLFLQVCKETVARQDMLKQNRKKAKKSSGEPGEKSSTKSQKLSPLNKPEKVSTYEKTLGLIKEGLSIKDIAEKRSITEGTVLSHVLKLYETFDDLDLSALKPDKEILQKIETAMTELGDDIRGENGRILMTPIHQHLEESIPFDTIRLAMLFIKV